MARHKLQSAMEYLMTYGWAILIIAVVLGALFGLGFFNSANLAPKVAAGSCQVYRPQGPTSTSFINLEGTCNNELPQYVAQLRGLRTCTCYGDIAIPAAGLPLGNSPRSVFAWVYIVGPRIWPYTILSYGTTTPSSNEQFTLRVLQGAGCTVGYCADVYASSLGGAGLQATSIPISNNTWTFVGAVYSGGASNTITLYADLQSQSAPAGNTLNTIIPASNPAFIGVDSSTAAQWWYNGSISNVQIYNTSLSSNEVTALYQEGIGGSPIVLNNLVAWWPLNGNANDYSGNLNNGASTNVVFTNSWTSGYTAP